MCSHFQLEGYHNYCFHNEDVGVICYDISNQIINDIINDIKFINN